MSLKLDNLITLFDYLSQYAWRNIEQVAGKLQVDRRTVFRYLDEIEIAFGAFPVIERAREGVKLCRSDFLEFLEQREGYAGLAAVMSTPFGALVKPDKPLPDKLLKSVREMIETRAVISEGLARKLFEAIRTGNYLDVTYRSKTTPKKHRCAPIKLFMSSGIPYIVSFDEERDHLICLGVDKIENATKSKNFLESSTLGELRSYVNSAWGMMVQHKERKIIDVEFEAESSVATYFANAPLHPKQTTSEIKGKAVFHLPVHNEVEIARYLLRFGKAVQIRSPQSAIDELTAFLDLMGSFYK